MEPVAVGSTGEAFSNGWRHNIQQVWEYDEGFRTSKRRYILNIWVARVMSENIFPDCLC